MKRLKADQFSIGASNGGRTSLRFKDGSGDEIEVSFPSIGIMGLAMALRQRAKDAPVPMLLAKPARFRRIEGPPSHPTLKAGSEPEREAKEPPHISIGVTADLDSVWVLLVSKREDGTPTSDQLILPLADAEVIAKGFQDAVAAIKHKPRATKH